MSFNNKEEYNAYMRQYMLDRYHTQREKLLKLLDNKCTKCGSTENLEFDHIDPSTKSFTIGKLNTMAFYKAVEEVKKCQLLCQSCHNSKTINEKGFQEVKGKDVHGTLSSCRYCKCDICKTFKNEYNRENYRKLHLDANENNLTNEKVIDIFKSNEPTELLANRFNISKSTIKSIRSGSTWSNVTKGIFSEYRNPQIITVLTKEIISDIVSGEYKQAELVRKYKMSKERIRKIKKLYGNQV